MTIDQIVLFFIGTIMMSLAVGFLTHSIPYVFLTLGSMWTIMSVIAGMLTYLGGRSHG